MSAAMHQLPHRQRGVAAIELALGLPLLATLLLYALYLGHLCWHYAVIHKAAQSAAHYMASTPLQDIQHNARAQAAAQMAEAIARQQLAGLNTRYTPTVNVFCGDGIVESSCDGYSVPTTVRVLVRAPLENTWFPAFDRMRVLPIANLTMTYGGK